jgi:ABC-2 type transport system ATP-binding protein
LNEPTQETEMAFISTEAETSDNRDELVRFSHLTRDFNGFRAVDRLNLTVGAGEFFGFLGPNGAGKSTTIKMAVGLLRPTSGSVRVFGMDPYERPLAVKARIGVVPEELSLYERLTGEEALVFSGRLYGLDPHTAAGRAADLMEWLGLEEAGSSLIVDYSKGMKRKIALGCALIHRPKLLFLDEPFSGIDPLALKKIKDVLGRMAAEGTTIFFSSHIMELVERLCSRIAILHKGRVHTVGTLEQMREALQLPSDATLEDVFVKTVGVPIDHEEASWLTS